MATISLDALTVPITTPAVGVTVITLAVKNYSTTLNPVTIEFATAIICNVTIAKYGVSVADAYIIITHITGDLTTLNCTLHIYISKAGFGAGVSPLEYSSENIAVSNVQTSGVRFTTALHKALLATTRFSTGHLA